MNDVKRGFAAMTPEQRFKAQSRGGKRTQSLGKGHRWDSKSAAEASRLGDNARKKKALSTE